MARAVFRKVSAESDRRLVHLDRDRALVEAALREPARFDALYRKYLAQVYSYAYYELGDHHDAEDATERTFLLALGALPRFEERARPADGEGASTFRVWLFQIARNVVANVRRTRRRRPEAPLEAAAALVAPVDVEGGATQRLEADEAWAAVEPAARGPPPCPRVALRRGDVDLGDRRGPRSIGGGRPGPHPSRPARGRTRPGRALVTSFPREAGEIDALVTDGYLESLLIARERRAVDTPSSAELDPAVRRAAARLAAAVIRVHPSFRFEDRLAARLADAAARMSLARAAGDEASLGALPASVVELELAGSPLGPADPLDLLDPARPEDDGGIPRRPLLIGGTLASAALSIAGAAIVAWRLNRTPRSRTERVRLA